MSIEKPYYRIMRPTAYESSYVLDSRYASDRLQLCRAFCSIEKDLLNIFDYIEPDENNKDVFSFELYSLLLRACTEVELNCKEIMVANGVTPHSMSDYKKLEKSSKLSKYTVEFRNWRQRNLETGNIEYATKSLQPFINFYRSESPQWYQDYNAVKHNREANLEKANLDNCINAVAGILVLLFSQFGFSCIESSRANRRFIELDNDYSTPIYVDASFDILPPSTRDWEEDELYDHNCLNIGWTDNPFDQFDFG